MRTTSLFTTLLSAVAVSARITGFAVPKTIAPDSTIKILITVENFIQSIQDVAFSFGLAPANATYTSSGALGTLLDSKFLGPDDSNVVGNITHYVHIPATTKKGEYTFTGAHFSLIGAVYSPNVESYVVNVTVGRSTSSVYVQSTELQSQS